MRAIHNTPLPTDQWEFPIPDDCQCDGKEQCEPCNKVEAELEKQWEEERQAEMRYGETY
jgi:hypothetical protein